MDSPKKRFSSSLGGEFWSYNVIRITAAVWENSNTNVSHRRRSFAAEANCANTACNIGLLTPDKLNRVIGRGTAWTLNSGTASVYVSEYESWETEISSVPNSLIFISGCIHHCWPAQRTPETTSHSVRLGGSWAPTVAWANPQLPEILDNIGTGTFHRFSLALCGGATRSLAKAQPRSFHSMLYCGSQPGDQSRPTPL